jgi:hypothetical protein
MSSKKPFAENLGELNIAPIAVSYEYEPCDFLKTRELYITRRQTYVKQAGEDLHSILHGILLFKGGTHYTFCDVITEKELEECALLPHAERFKRLAEIIDQRIYAGYKLWKTNYIAHDLRGQKAEFSDKYSSDEKQKFIDYMNGGLATLEGEKDELREIFLGIYANVMDNKKTLY